MFASNMMMVKIVWENDEKKMCAPDFVSSLPWKYALIPLPLFIQPPLRCLRPQGYYMGGSYMVCHTNYKGPIFFSLALPAEGSYIGGAGLYRWGGGG